MHRTRNHTERSTCVTHAMAMIMAALLLAGILQICASGVADDSDTELAKKTQNPVADLISVPFQNNFNFSAGPKDAMIYVLNVQPVIPLRLTEDWNLITRLITPIINQPSLFDGADSAFGLGDINPTFFLSPAKPGELIWGVGPTFTLPTATDSLLGTRKWSMGPAAVALTIQRPFVTRPRPSALEPIGIVLPKLQTPLTDSFIGHVDAAFEQELLHVAVAQLKAIVEPDPVTDDFAGKAVIFVALGVGGRGHAWLPLCACGLMDHGGRQRGDYVMGSGGRSTS
jgi:hypothetical protein